MSNESVPADPNVTPAASPAAISVPTRRSRRWLWFAGPALVLGGAAWMYVHGGRYVETDNAYVQADRITISPQIAGSVVEVLVHQNQAVKAGDVLFRLDPQPLEIALARAEAQLAAMGDMLQASRDDVRSAQAKLHSSESGVRWNQQVYDRQQELRKKGLVPQQSLDSAVHDLDESRADREVAQAALARVTSIIGGGVNAPVQDIPAYKVGMAQLAQAKLDLERSVVRAPVDGIIGKEDLQPGEFLAVGQPAMPLVATGQLWIEANFKETDLTDVAVGQSAEIEVDSYPGLRFKAKVASISPASGSEFSVLPAQNATGNWVKIVQRIPVRLVLDEALPSGKILRAGMSAQVEIDTGAENARMARLFGNSSVPVASAATAAHD